MSWGPRWTPERLAAFREKQHRLDIGRPRQMTPPIVGEANANDKPRDGIPILTDAVAGPGARKKKPKRTRRPEERPYYQALCALLPKEIPRPTPEFRFDPTRRWRLDFCFEAPAKIGIEISGGIFANGRHSRGTGMLADWEKHNAATLAGYRVFYFSPQQIAEAAALIRELFAR